MLMDGGGDVSRCSLRQEFESKRMPDTSESDLSQINESNRYKIPLEHLHQKTSLVPDGPTVTFLKYVPDIFITFNFFPTDSAAPF